MYGEAPTNITKISLSCQLGYITNLVDFGLSTEDSRCPNARMDDAMHVNHLIDSVATDSECNYRNLDPNSSQYRAINSEFNKTIDKTSANFSMNTRTMFTPSCYRKLIELNRL